MSERISGILQVMTPFPGNKSELLFVTSDRVIVARLPKYPSVEAFASSGDGLSDLVSVGFFVLDHLAKHERKEKEFRRKVKHLTTTHLENVLKADKRNLAIPHAEITKIELKKRWGARIDLNVITSTKKHKWCYYCLMKKGVNLYDNMREQMARGTYARLEDCESLLRPIFGDKLTVKK